MNDLQDLYREVILDHNRTPRNFGELEDANRIVEGENPLCSDRITLYVKIDGNTVEDISFTGNGCAISVASSSLMTERVRGISRQDNINLFNKVHDMLTANDYDSRKADDLEKLAALSGVREYPTRIKCASLAWHALKNALTDASDNVSTE